MGTSQPPVQYLFASSESGVEAVSLSFQNQLVNAERSLTDLLDRWLQIQNAERLGRTVLQLRRAYTDSQSLVRSFGVRCRLFASTSAILGVPSRSTAFRSLAPIKSTRQFPLLLRGSAFAVDEQSRLHSAVELGVKIGFLAGELMPALVRPPLNSSLSPAPHISSEPLSSASSNRSYDGTLRIYSTPTASSPSAHSPLERRPTPDEVRIARARFGCFPGRAKKLLRAGEVLQCEKIA